MKIVFDNIVYSLQRAGGISVVWSNLVTRILKIFDHVYCIEYQHAEKNISRKAITIEEDKVEHRNSCMMKVSRYLSPSIQEDSPFIFHSSYFRTCGNSHAVNVTTVHDFTYELYVKNPIKRWLHCWQKHRAIRHSDMIVCISENTKADLFRFLPDIPHEKVRVIYNGADDVFHVIDGDVTENFALFVGNRDPYKNFDKIIEPLAELDIPLRIVGAPLTKREKELLASFRCQYEFLGYVSNAELNRLYNHAYCLLYPSEYEGFGLPVIEAQKAGCPVIAFNGSSVREIIGDSTLLLQDMSKEELLKKIKVLSNPAIRKEVVDKGLGNARKYSWEHMAKLYYQLYQEIYDKICKVS